MVIQKKCNYCGDIYSVIPSRDKRTKFCSRKCFDLSKKGKHLSPQTEFTKGCISIMKGKSHTKEAKEKNRIAHLKENPKPSTIYWRFHNEARKKLISLGFDIRGKVVHHKNGNYKDNSLKNLQIFNSNNEHTKLHYQQGDYFKKRSLKNG